MSECDIIRAWKDPEYRAGLSGSKLEQLPKNPAGMVELTDADLLSIGGAEGQELVTDGRYTIIVTAGPTCGLTCDASTCIGPCPQAFA